MFSKDTTSSLSEKRRSMVMDTFTCLLESLNLAVLIVESKNILAVSI